MVAKILVLEKGHLYVKIENKYTHCLYMMNNKYLRMGLEVKGNIIIIDSFDGSLHLSTNTKDAGTISYSSLLLYPNYFVLGVSSATSTCILMWMNSLTEGEQGYFLSSPYINI